jgi:hypothetical protein
MEHVNVRVEFEMDGNECETFNEQVRDYLFSQTKNGFYWCLVG